MANFWLLYVGLIALALVGILACALWRYLVDPPRCVRCGRRVRAARDGFAVFDIYTTPPTASWYCRRHGHLSAVRRANRAS